MGTEQYPHALPVASHLTKKEVEHLIALFGSLVHSGPLAGRMVYASLTKASEEDAIQVLCEFRERVHEALEKYRAQYGESTNDT